MAPPPADTVFKPSAAHRPAPAAHATRGPAKYTAASVSSKTASQLLSLRKLGRHGTLATTPARTIARSKVIHPLVNTWRAMAPRCARTAQPCLALRAISPSTLPQRNQPRVARLCRSAARSTRHAVARAYDRNAHPRGASRDFEAPLIAVAPPLRFTSTPLASPDRHFLWRRMAARP
jgi:hypothetical protein